jgi:hypothetical protein
MATTWLMHISTMLCIPANPDISGIGICATIYTQNIIFAFAPVISALWDSKVMWDELEPIEDQSASTLTIAFTLLLSMIIQAKTGILSSFHAAFTSMTIWFLLYCYHRSMASDNAYIPATWSSWLQGITSLISSWKKDGEPVGDGNARDVESTGGVPSPGKEAIEQKGGGFMKRLQKKFILVLGSLHLSLMASIGIWLWSNLSQFGTPSPSNAGPCSIPSYSILGSDIPLTSLALHSVSLIIYVVLLIPGLNLIIPLLFSISIHILYSHIRDHFSLCTASHPSYNESNLKSSQSRSKKPAHVAMLNAGFLFLFAFNAVFIIDREIMLS